MSETPWIERNRTKPQPREREDPLTALTSEQKERLLKHDYVWIEGVGVLWKASNGAMRHTRFTHGTYFRTQRGEFYIDSAGSARELSNEASTRVAPEECVDPRTQRSLEQAPPSGGH